MFKLKNLKALIFAVPFSLLLARAAYAGSYTVTENDSLYKISNLFQTTSNDIAKSNSLSGTTIYPGQILSVPCNTYSVKSGDTLYKVSNSYSIPLYSLKKANNEWDNIIYPGQKLNLPGIKPSGSQLTPLKSASPAVIPYTSSELDLLARLITAEADGQPYTAKVGVGAVVVNRFQDPDYPKSVGGVIYQKDAGYYQFTPVENGWINKPASSDAKNAAYEALHGSDPTNGALFYFDDSTTNAWIWSKPIALRSGNMVFSY